MHERFTPLVAALSALQCAALVEDLSRGAVALPSLYTFLAMLLLADAVVFLGPLIVFTDRLWAARTRGVGAYMKFADRYVAAFERKWLGGTPPSDPMLGTPDVQTLADLNNSISVVRHMKWIPAGPRLLTMMTAAAVVPLLPLVLFKYPVTELARKFLARLIGL